MAKKKAAARRQRRRTIAASGVDDGADDGDPPFPAHPKLNWANIPGRRLDVDIASGDGDDDDGDGRRSKEKRSRSDPDDLPRRRRVGSDDEGEFDAARWTSRHYDDDEASDGGGETDLFDPDPDANANKFDAGSKVEGANDAGMFLSLEVIPADAYRVERTGDEASGFVTKVVFNETTPKASPQDDRDDDTGSPLDQKLKQADSETKVEARRETTNKGDKPVPAAKTAETLDKKERQKKERLERKKLKRKAKREQAKERKRLKKEQSETKTSTGAASKSLQEPPKDEATTQKDQSSKGAAHGTTSETVAATEAAGVAVTDLQTTWSVAAPGITLHPTLCAGLLYLNYAYPTPIQSASLPAAILGRRDIVGAAPTGSGKTLSYGLPVLQYLLERGDAEEEGSDEINEREGTAKNHRAEKEGSDEKLPLQALILTPTRELALQVTSELARVCLDKVKIGTIVGGFAEVKQRRTLEKTRPPVLVGTPGRLWELMSSKEYSHLNNLTQLRFLIVDEADRLIKQGSFPQLRQIFDVINHANPPPEDNASEEEGDDSDDDDDGRLKSLRGVRGEAKVVMLDDSILAAIERERSGENFKDGVPKPMEMDDDEYEEQQKQICMEEEGSENDSEVGLETVHRQTFVYSATLMLPPSMHHLIKKDAESTKKFKKKKGRNKQPATVDGAIAEILDVAGARGETKVVDMSNAATTTLHPEGGGKKGNQTTLKDTTKNSKNAASKQHSLATRLPSGLTLGEIRCAQRHKDSHLYAYLVTTRQGSSGPCLVFCNSIAAVRRVGETLKTLGLPVKMLHAQMAQKSRLGALESLRTSNSRSIVVASDVAARGLDILSVTTVIHYDAARVVDTFIHRAGRTARGVGETAVGTSISLVAPAEEREHQKICEAVQGTGSRSLELVHIDGRLLNEAQERVALATKIVVCNDVESQASRKNKWLQDAAKEAGLEVDEDMMESSLLDGDRRDRQRFLEAKRARAELRQLLAKPMRKQHFGKFLSGVGLRDSIKSESEVNPFVVKNSFSKRRHKRKKVSQKK